VSLSHLFQPSKNTERALQILKWIALIVIGGIALTTIDFRAIISHMNGFQPSTLLIFIAFVGGARLLYTLRWRLISISSGTPLLTLWFWLRVNLLSEFVSIVLPSYLGGDGLRLLKLRPHTERSRDAALSVLIDRVIGVITLGLAALVCLPLLLPYLTLDLSVDVRWVALIVVLALVVMIAVGFVLWRMFRLQLPALLRDLHFDRRKMGIAFAFSVAGHSLYAAGYVVLFVGLAPLAPLPLLAIILLALLTRTLPLSFLGIEVSDGSLVVLAGLLNIEPSLSLTVVALVLSSRYLFALIGFLWELAADGITFLRRIVRPQDADPIAPAPTDDAASSLPR